MRSDGRDRSRFTAPPNLPAIDHEAHGPVSALVQLAAWFGRLWSERADKSRNPLILTSGRWL